MESFRQLHAPIRKLRILQVKKMGQILCVKRVLFCKSTHIYGVLCVVFLFRDACTKKRANVAISGCELRPLPPKTISQRAEEFGTIYQINSPNYFIHRHYPSKTYCVWNIANEGVVTYRVVDLMLQNATTDCDEDDKDCKCPDFMKIVIGGNKLKLCGSKRPATTN